MAYTTINKSTDFFNIKLWTGNASARSITGVGFQPDFVWTKRRDSAGWHYLQDAVRGAANTIYSNATNIQTSSGTGGVTSFDSDGFSIGTYLDINANGGTYVGWNWKANGQGSANNDGSINTTYTSANTTAGISIVKYTGNGSVSTVGHGLGVAPKLIIVKRLTGGTEAWPVDCRAASGIMYLNETGALGSYGDSSPFPSTAPTTSVFSIGTANNANANGSDFVAYCFAEKKGFSKIGTYSGNGNASGSFIYTGFKPAFAIVKCTSHSGESWWMGDNKRPGFNVSQKALLAENSAAEVDASYQAVDFLSNGIKWRGTNDRVNASGKTYTYIAFAEAPLVGSNNIPATAR